jgi:hypothetical protein
MILDDGGGTSMDEGLTPIGADLCFKFNAKMSTAHGRRKQIGRFSRKSERVTYRRRVVQRIVGKIRGAVRI